MKKLILMLGCLLLLVGCTPAKPDVIASDINVNNEVSDKTQEYLGRYLDSFLPNGYELPSLTNDNQEVTWTVISGQAYIEDNKIYKKDDADEYEHLSLSAEVNGQTYPFTNLLLLDEYAGYLMVYFVGEGEGKEQMRMAFTYNGEFWYVLNNQQTVLQATKGTKRLRDPSIVRKKDGSFAIIATQGYDNSSIYVWDTLDFTSFENERLIQVNTSSDTLTMSEKQAWAPEAFYDHNIDKYFIYWSSPTDGGMYYNYSDDLNDISYPQKLLDCGFTVIDGTIVKIQDQYSIILKDEREPMEQYSQLFLGHSDSDYLHFDHFDTAYVSGHQMEGPFVLKGDYSYLMYYDDYTRSQFKASRFYIMDSDSFVEIPETELMFPMKNVKHGYAIPLTFNELEKVIEKYGN